MRPKTARLTQLFDLVPEGTACVIDVGTDHALLPIALVSQGRCARAIASDVRPEPLIQARMNIMRAGVKEKVEVRLGPGLSTLAQAEAEVCVIAGVGFGTIAQILEDHDPLSLGITHVILQTPKGGMKLRRWLLQVKGWRLEQEMLLYDHGRPYVTCLALPHQKPDIAWTDLSPTQQLVAPTMKTHTPRFFARYAAARLVSLERAIQGMRRAEHTVAHELEALEQERALWAALKDG